MGRTQETLDAVAEDIRSRGGMAETAVLDALDEEAVDAHADAMPVGAQEYLRRNLAAELGSYGVRVLTIQTGGVPDSIPDEFPGKGEIARSIEAPTLLGRAASLEDVGNVAAFAASDWARTMTGSALNITCGTEIG